MRALLLSAIGLLACSSATRAQDVEALRAHADAWERLLAAEDARAETPARLETLALGSTSPVADLRVVAVRALGRLERPDVLPLIVPLLHDSVAAVRAAAAHATAQAVYRVTSPAARQALHDALPAARADAAVIAAVAESLGRLRTSTEAEARAVVQSLLPHLAASTEAQVGVLRGLYFLARQQASRGAFDSTAVMQLRAHAVAGPPLPDTGDVRVRTLALMILPLVGGADEATLTAALEHPSPLVQREALAGAAALRDTAAVRRVIEHASGSSPIVRYERLRLHARRLAPTHGCAPIFEAARNAETHTALLGIDMLATVCAADARSVTLADSIARATAPDAQWHRGAHAIVSLAALDAARAVPLLGRYAASDHMFVRMYAARAAAAARDTTLLRTLAADPHPNVRALAIQGLAASIAHAADDVYIAALDTDAAEVLMAAATALKESTSERAVPALLDALERVSAQRIETSRDARLAILERVAELAQTDDAARLRPYLRDFDHAVAAAAVDIIARLTGTRPVMEPRPLPRLPRPTFEQAAELENTRVLVIMESGDTVQLRLLPFIAPTNSYRFARLARAGHYDGLTLHRIVFNFVAQGGSPAANEYTGDGPFTRDELGAPNWRGTVGLSTRGRDTGDAQFYINHIDNVRLDHEYTVFAVVISGMDVVDMLQEGARIRRVVIH